LLVLTQLIAFWRGLHNTVSAVKQLAAGANLALQQPTSLKDFGVLSALLQIPPMPGVAAYGSFCRSDTTDATLRVYQCSCVTAPRCAEHAHPTAIMAGDCETGISIMQMDKLDTGPIYLQRAIPIDPAIPRSVNDRLAATGALALLECWSASRGDYCGGTAIESGY